MGTTRAGAAIAITVVLTAGVTTAIERTNEKNTRAPCQVSQLVSPSNSTTAAFHRSYETIYLAVRPGAAPCSLNGPLRIEGVDATGEIGGLHRIYGQSDTLDSSSGLESALPLDADTWASVNLAIGPTEQSRDSCPSGLISVERFEIYGNAQVRPLNVHVADVDRPLRLCGGFGDQGTFAGDAKSAQRSIREESRNRAGASGAGS